MSKLEGAKKGGQSRSEAKKAASSRNLSKARLVRQQNKFKHAVLEQGMTFESLGPGETEHGPKT